jgi:UDP-3-O-[3-hydroxymyristoyl] glucosamine N-acyltransferase
MRVDQIAKLVNGQVQGEASREITGVASLDSAVPTDIAFAADRAALERLSCSHAGCVLVPCDAVITELTVVTVAAPKLAFIRVASALRPRTPAMSGVHPTAVVAPDAILGPDVSAGPFVAIAEGARVGARTELGTGVEIGRGARIGEDCILHPRTVVCPGARIGDRVVLHAGVVVGGDGFGYVLAEGRQWKFPQLGGVVIEDDVEIGCNTTIDRGSLGVTVIGEGAKIDNLVQIAHNVRIGKHCVIAAQTGVSGSVEVGDYAVIGGQVGIGDHVVIEGGAQIGSKGGILPGKIVRKGSVVWGIPARPLNVFKRQYAHLSRLPDLADRVADLERKSRQVRKRKRRKRTE